MLGIQIFATGMIFFVLTSVFISFIRNDDAEIPDWLGDAVGLLWIGGLVATVVGLLMAIWIR